MWLEENKPTGLNSTVQEANVTTGVTVQDIIGYVETLTGHSLNRDEGVHHGFPASDVSGATMCWMTTPAAIASAGRRGDDLLIGHESLYYPYDVVNRTDQPAGWRDWQTNSQRRAALERYDLTFLRLHGSVDEICIFDEFARLMGLGEPAYVDGWVKVFEIRECSLEELIARVKEKTKMESLRVSRPAAFNSPVRRVGLPLGGLGLFVNVSYQQRLIEQNCDVFIAGESDNYGFRFSQECGIPMIGTGHEISENPGLRRFTEMLARAFPALRWRFFENPCVWEVE